MLTENPRTFAAAAAAIGLALFALGFAAGWLTDDTGRPLARAVPLAAAPGAVRVTRPGTAGPLPPLRKAPQARRPKRVKPSAVPAPPPRRKPAPKPVTIVGTG
jgi:hypothetical protein